MVEMRFGRVAKQEASSQKKLKRRLPVAAFLIGYQRQHCQQNFIGLANDGAGFGRSYTLGFLTRAGMDSNAPVTPPTFAPPRVAAKHREACPAILLVPVTVA